MCENHQDEKLIIRNFACFREAEVHFRGINIFIGPQAAGKSLILKLHYFFRSLFFDILNLNPGHPTHGMPEQRFRDFFDHLFPPESRSNGDWLVRLEAGEIEITISGTGASRPDLIFSTLVQRGLAAKAEYEAAAGDIDQGPAPISQWEMLEHLFIPAGRSLYSSFSQALPALVRMEAPLDKLLLDFSVHVGKALRPTPTEISPSEQERLDLFDELASSILKGRHLRLAHEDAIEHPDGRRVLLRYASAAQQEVFPLLAILRRSCVRMNKVLYIEEPEAHLFPESQLRLVQLLALVANLASRWQQLLITTHSPYILTSINNLLMAQQVASGRTNGGGDEVASVVARSLWINPEFLRAYQVTDGIVTNILDSESGLITAEAIDTASDMIGDQFDELMRLDLQKR